MNVNILIDKTGSSPTKCLSCRQNNSNIDSVTFTVPRYVDGTDLSNFSCRLALENPADVYEKNDNLKVTVRGDSIEVLWTIDERATYSPDRLFQIVFYRISDIKYKWHSQVFRLLCSPCLNPEGTISEYEPNLLVELEDRIKVLEGLSSDELLKKVAELEKKIPKNTSDLVNDSGFISAIDLTNLSEEELKVIYDVAPSSVIFNGTHYTFYRRYDKNLRYTALGDVDDLKNKTLEVWDVGTVNTSSVELADKKSIEAVVKESVKGVIPTKVSDLDNDENFVSKDEISSTVETALREAKESGDFKGEKGDSFTYDDFTPEQLESLKGKDGEKGSPFTYDDFTPEQLADLKGEQGIPGEDGYTPQKGVDYFDGTKGDKGDPFTFEDFTEEQLSSLKGKDGSDGKDGLTPYIKNNNWWIGDTDTHIKAVGSDGAQGKDGTKGADGLTPFINEKGNWQIGDFDTNVKAQGEKGEAGQGYTLTEEDISTIVSQVSGLITEDLSKGVLLKDSTTNKTYKVFVDNDKLKMEVSE